MDESKPPLWTSMFALWRWPIWVWGFVGAVVIVVTQFCGKNIAIEWSDFIAEQFINHIYP